MTDIQRDTFIDTITDFDFTLPPKALDLLQEYVDLLFRANRRTNLVSSTDLPIFWTRHILDSIAPLLLKIVSGPAELLDIGSGAGLPGIPIAICAPNLDVTMVESIGKKARFIERAVSALDLPNARAEIRRYESLDRMLTYDFCVSRAVSSVADMLPSISRLVRPGGKAIFYKSREFASELSESNVLDEFGSPTVYSMGNYAAFGGRVLIVFERL
jgi:16S rRNA (guanine527-N7)-methyltransferase